MIFHLGMEEAVPSRFGIRSNFIFYSLLDSTRHGTRLIMGQIKGNEIL